jgi:hypothetical protein
MGQAGGALGPALARKSEEDALGWQPAAAQEAVAGSEPRRFREAGSCRPRLLFPRA